MKPKKNKKSKKQNPSSYDPQPKVISNYADFISGYESIDEAIKMVNDNRKFEIELYWKRAVYFWTFIGVTFAGYFAVMGAKSDTSSVELDKLQFILNCIGIVFSVAWYFVNRGSKYWQLNWERQLDVLESIKVGPVYKTLIHMEKYRTNFLSKPLDAHVFSVTKINHLLNLFIIGIWLVLLVNFMSANLALNLSSPSAWLNFYTLSLIFTGGFVFALFQWGRKSKPEKDGKTTIIHFERRGVENKPKED